MKKSVKYLISLLGIPVVSACPMAMYGCPHAEYTVRATVQDEAGEPIKGIEVSFGYQKDTTAANGRVVLSGSETFISEETLILRDIDGPENGSYLPKEEPIKFTQVKEGDGSWYQGAYEADVTVVMKQDKE